MADENDDSKSLAIEFGRRLRRARESQGLTQTYLAEAAGLTSPAVSQIEAGQRLPAFKTQRKLAKALDTTVGYLVGEEAPQMPPEFRAHFRDLDGLGEDAFKQLRDYAQYLISKQRSQGK